MINIYCDESCHLEHVGDYMVLGAMKCSQNKVRRINNDIRDIKIKHGLSSWLEIKWSKVSNSKESFYLELIDYFFNTDSLSFRAVVCDKKVLNHETYNQDHNLWYYKMYYTLIYNFINPKYFSKRDKRLKKSNYKVFIDIKDTIGGPKIRELKRILDAASYRTYDSKVSCIHQINSRESEILQLVDLIIGALSYYNRGLYNQVGSNSAKNSLVRKLIEDYNKNLGESTSISKDGKANVMKFDLLHWPSGKRMVDNYDF